MGANYMVSMTDPHTGRRLTWPPTQARIGRRFELVLLLVAMPAMSVVSSVRAQLRMWILMTGSWNLNRDLQSMPYARVKALELGTYQQDLELAAGSQYVCVACFVMLVLHIFEKRLYIDKSKVLGEFES